MAKKPGNRKPGRPAVYSPCGKCGEPFPQRVLKFHISWCRGKEPVPILFTAVPSIKL